MTKRSITALAILGVIIIAFLALQTPLLSHIRGLAWHVWVGAVTRVFPVGKQSVENDVQAQLERLVSENIRLKAEQKDYQRLRQQLGSPAFSDFRTIPAVVGARPLDPFAISLLINRGAKDGVTAGAPVTVYGSTILGFISELHENTAVVQLLLHPSTNLAVEVLGEQATQGLLVGQQFTSLAVTTLPRDVEITSGQEIVTIANEGVPYGLRVGTVGSIERKEDQAYQQVSVALPYDPDHLRAVTVIVAP